MTTSRRVMKAEKPRPLKISTTDQSMEVVLAEMDSVSQHLASSPSDRGLYSAVISLCENLKMFGPQLENVYKDQLDRCLVAIRNGCRDDNISLASRYRLLEVIELRAMQWQPNENLVHYYKQKLAHIEAEESALEEQDNNYTPPTSVMSPMFTSNYQPFTNPPQTGVYPSQSQTKSHQHPNVPNPPTLAPGEIIKSSGKFTKPTRIPGKNFCKDEVVIRNPDSGKVMGLKGRRVHMIEELSETIISFQRVSPGARERLVQITGPNEENISQAKQLIEDTIRRNSSPIRPDERSPMYNNLGGSSSSISSHASDDALQGTKRPSLAGIIHQEPLTEYKYTVIHNDDVIRITGSNLDLVRTAKLVLDEFFNSEQNLKNSAPLLSPHIDYATNFFPVENSSINSSTSADSLDINDKKVSEAPKDPPTLATPPKLAPARVTTPTEEKVESSKPAGVSVVRQPLIPSSSKEAICTVEKDVTSNSEAKNRRALFAKTSEDKSQQSNDGDACASSAPSSPVPVPDCGRRCYTRDFMVECATSALARRTPNTWSSVIRLAPLIVKKGTQMLPTLQATINEKGEACINNAVTYLEESDLLNGNTLLKNTDYKWTLGRSLSGVEEDDNGNS